jgi:hypothetical protein
MDILSRMRSTLLATGESRVQGEGYQSAGMLFLIYLNPTLISTPAAILLTLYGILPTHPP